jgi:SAM-dependent methyltransferase
VGLSDLFSRRRKEHTDSDTGASDAPVHPTRALPKFLESLATREQPLLLDLGPVVGQSLTFFGEQLGCKIFVEDLAKDLDRQAVEGKPDDLVVFYARRFPQQTASIDGVLCWDLFEFLDKASAVALLKQLTRVMRPDGALLAFFNTSEAAPNTKPQYTRYVVTDPAHLQHRPYPAQQARQKPLNNRDIQRLFEPLRVTEQFLLKSTMREVLFRKPHA